MVPPRSNPAVVEKRLEHGSFAWAALSTTMWKATKGEKVERGRAARAKGEGEHREDRAREEGSCG